MRNLIFTTKWYCLAQRFFLAAIFSLLTACTAFDATWTITVHLSTDNGIAIVPAPTGSPTATSNDVANTFEIFANKAWQDSHIMLTIGQRVTVTYISGAWTEQLNVVPFHNSADSTNYICGHSDCSEPAPDLPKGTLIARVGGGGAIIEIGTGRAFVANSTGTLALRMNDADTGLDDNAGSVIVQIKVN